MTEETLEPVETETDPEERIRELTAENRRLRKLSLIHISEPTRH